METYKKNLLFIYFGVLMFLFSQVSHVSSATDTISTNQPLLGFHTIVSSGDIFEFGLFYPDPGNYTNFYIGMWYRQVSPRTIVWVANRESPTLRETHNYILKISDGNLILSNNSTATALWSTGVNSSRSKDVQAVLLDNGNLVLRDGPTSSDAVLWQSFDHPSDTWLLGAKIRFNNIKLESQRLTSWKNLKDPSPGRYSLQFDPNITHSLIAVWNGYKSYWSSGPWDDQLKNFRGIPSPRFILISFKLNMDESYITYSVPDPPDSTYHLVMDVSGRFMLKVWLDFVQLWEVYFSQPQNRCEIYNYCGSFGICNDTEELHPCRCVPGFEPEFRKGWDSDDFSGGCIRETKLHCGKGNDEFLPIKNMKLAIDPTTTLVLAASLVTTCASSCLADCSCKAYAYDGNKCLIWASDVFNLQHLDANQGHTFFLRRAASNISSAVPNISPAASNISPANSNKGKTKHSKGRRTVLLVVLSSLVAAATFFVGLHCFISSRRRRNKTQRDEKQSREPLEGGVIDDDGEHMCYLNLHDIMAATNSFSEENKLGEGGFGPVYKGKLPNGMDVVIKRLSKKSSQGLTEFKNEVVLIIKLQHKNLVRFLAKLSLFAGVA